MRNMLREKGMYGTAYFLTKFLTKANNLITLNVFVNVK